MKLKMSDGGDLSELEALIKSAEDLIEENRVRMTRYSNARNNVQKTLRTPPDEDTNRQNSEVLSSNNDDDVIFVRSGSIPGPAVINLCTPINRRRRRQATSDSSYNLITIEDVPTDDTPQQKRMNTTPDSDNNKGSERLICPICLESVAARNPTSTICGHIFCRSCITNAIKVAKRCPMCKKKIGSAKYIHPIYLS